MNMLDSYNELLKFHQSNYYYYLAVLQAPDKLQELEMTPGEVYVQLIEHARALERFNGDKKLNELESVFTSNEREILLSNALEHIQAIDMREELDTHVDNFLLLIENDEAEPEDYIDIIDAVTSALSSRESYQDIADGIRTVGSAFISSSEELYTQFRSFLDKLIEIDDAFLSCPPLTLEAAAPFRTLSENFSIPVDTDTAWWYLSEEKLVERCENHITESQEMHLAMLEAKEAVQSGANIFLELTSPDADTPDNVLTFQGRSTEVDVPVQKALLAAKTTTAKTVTSVSCELQSLPEIVIQLRCVADMIYQLRAFNRNNPASSSCPAALIDATVQVHCDGVIIAKASFDIKGEAKITLPEKNALYYMTDVVIFDGNGQSLGNLKQLN